MKRIIIALTVAFMAQGMAGTVNAQGLLTKKEYQGKKERSTYMQGAVPEENGKVVFRTTIATPGKSTEDVFRNLKQWATLRYLANTTQGIWTDPNFFKNGDYARVAESDDKKGFIACQGDEEMVFTSRSLVHDAAQYRYILEINVAQERVEAVVRNIAYTYALSDHAERIEAEDWITDKEAFSKKGKMLHGSAKFRIKTIDTIDELFKEIGEAANKQ